MLSGDNSILQKATTAKKNTDSTQIKERIQLAYQSALAGGKGSYTKDTLMKELENEFGTDYDVDDSDDNNWKLKAHGQEIIIQAGNKIKVDRSGISVGDYIDYKPKTLNTTYSKNNLGEKYTGSNDNSNDLTQEILDWQVLTIYDNGSMDLIGSPTNQVVKFYGARGYNNGITILHDICKKLYSNTEHSIIARSVSLSDFENNMTETGKNARNEYNKDYEYECQYGKTNFEKWNNVYTDNNIYYPNIYSNENGSGIDTTTLKLDGLNDAQNEEIDSSDNEQYQKAQSELTTKQTYYWIDINQTNYGDASRALSNSNYYWIASHCVACWSSDAGFGLRGACSVTSAAFIYYSNNGTNTGGMYIRPVITIGTNINVTPCSGENSTTNMHTINW